MRNSIRIPICRVKSVAAFLIGKAVFLYSAPWCNGNTSDSDSGITGSNPVGTAPGCSYNGYYSRLLICQIRVRIPGGPYGSID